MNEVGAASIDLWLFQLDCSGSIGLSPAEESLLDARELQRAGNYRLARDRRSYALTRIAVRNLLSRYEPAISPASWRFQNNQHGKPEIASPATDRPLHFNLSHSGSRLAIAVSRIAPVGVDVESLDRARDFQRIARRRLTSTESAELCDLPPAELPLRFYELWTLKEAYVKAVGEGLTLSLRSFNLRMPGRQEIVLTGQQAGPDENWHLWLFDDLAGHRIGLATCWQPDIGVPAVRVLAADSPNQPGNESDAMVQLLRRTRPDKQAETH